jgi:hypothetical protein
MICPPVKVHGNLDFTCTGAPLRQGPQCHYHEGENERNNPTSSPSQQHAHLLHLPPRQVGPPRFPC